MSFFVITGTWASSAAKPTANKMNSFSFFGRSNNFGKKLTLDGVYVRTESPNKCRVLTRKPTEIPTDSLT